MWIHSMYSLIITWFLYAVCTSSNHSDDGYKKTKTWNSTHEPNDDWWLTINYNWIFFSCRTLTFFLISSNWYSNRVNRDVVDFHSSRSPSTIFVHSVCARMKIGENSTAGVNGNNKYFLRGVGEATQRRRKLGVKKRKWKLKIKQINELLEIFTNSTRFFITDRWWTRQIIDNLL